jgi:hypothetical protein
VKCHFSLSPSFLSPLCCTSMTLKDN